MFAAAHSRADGVCEHALDVRVAFLERLENAAEGAATACACDHVVDLSVQIFVDFGAGGFVMGQRVCHVAELPERYGAGNLRQEFFGLLFGAEHSLFAGGVDEFCAEYAKAELMRQAINQ